MLLASRIRSMDIAEKAKFEFGGSTASYDATKVKFDNGVITSDLFIIAKNNLDAANTNLINARYDYLIRTKILDYYQGKLSF